MTVQKATPPSPFCTHASALCGATLPQELLSLGVVELLLGVLQSTQPLSDRSCHELVVSALQLLQVVALSPLARRAIAGEPRALHACDRCVYVCACACTASCRNERA